MNSYIAIKRDKEMTVSLDDKVVIERYKKRINAIARFTTRKDELKKQGYHIQHVGVETIQGKRIEKSEPIQRQRKVRCLADI